MLTQPTPEPQPEPQPEPERAPQLLRRLMDEGGWTGRKLSKETERLGIRVAAGHINNIAGGRDDPSLGALQNLARAMGHPPTVFAEVRYARIRRLFDARDPEIGYAAAEANYRDLEAMLSAAARLHEQLSRD